MKKSGWLKIGIWVILFGFAFGAGFAQSNLLINGDLEDLTPNYWSPMGDGQTGVTCTWATAGYESMRSFMVAKTAATAEPAGWISENNANLYWNNAVADRVYNLTFYAKTQGVNTAPATDDAKIGVLYTFKAGDTVLGEQFVEVDQSAADADWTQYTAGLIIPAGTEPDEVTAQLWMGKDATGTVWFDNIDCGSDPWSMGIFNADAEIPEGWMEWHAGPEAGYSNLDDTEAHSGTWSALLRERDDESDEMVFYSEPVPVKPDTWYKIGVWVKRDSAMTNEDWLPSNVTDAFKDNRMNVCFFYHRDPIYEAWDLTGGDQFFYFDERDSSSGWDHFWVISRSPEDASGISVRARFNPFTKGYCWYDDFSVEELQVGDDILTNGDLEDLTPNFWETMGDEQTGVTCSWIALGYESMRSFKVEKTAATAEPAGWISENNANLYWNNAVADRVYNLSFYAKTVGVNAVPATDDAKIGVLYQFMAGGTVLGEQFVEVDQSVTDKDWTQYTGGLIIPAGTEPDEVTVQLWMGKDATGIVYFDNIDCGSDPWSMGVFNADAEIPEGWMEWHAGPTAGYSNLDDTEAHHGTWSALLKERDQESDEMVFYSEPVPVTPNAWYKIGVWVKRDSAMTNDEWLPTNITDAFNDKRMNICFFYHRDPIYESWDLTGGDQFFYFDERDSTSDWTYFTVLSQAPEDAAGISMRARFNPFTEGYCWYDQFSVEPVTVVETAVEDPVHRGSGDVPREFGLSQNYPNPFNPSTQIGFMLSRDGEVELAVYNAMGQRIRVLVSGHRQAGAYRVMWDGTNENGLRVDSGVYIYQLRVNGQISTRKMVMVK